MEMRIKRWFGGENSRELYIVAYITYYDTGDREEEREYRLPEQIFDMLGMITDCKLSAEEAVLSNLQTGIPGPSPVRVVKQECVKMVLSDGKEHDIFVLLSMLKTLFQLFATIAPEEEILKQFDAIIDLIFRHQRMLEPDGDNIYYDFE